MTDMIEGRGTYYVVLRGFEQRDVFQCEEDYEQFLGVFNRCKNCYMVFCYGYCLLPTACHCVVAADNQHVVRKAFLQAAEFFSVYRRSRTGRRAAVWDAELEMAALDTQAKKRECLMLLLSLPVWSGLSVTPSAYRYVYVDGWVE